MDNRRRMMWKKPPEYAIYYTSTDGNIVTPYTISGWGANIVSNTYENGVGKILFDKKVAKVPNNAFRNCSTLQSIELPDSVLQIGSNILYNCTSLEKTIIGKNVTSFLTYAFQTTPGELFISSNIPDFSGTSAFYGSTFTKVTFDENVVSIGKKAFYNCSSLTNIDMSNSVKYIEDSAFYNCAIKTLYIPDSVEKIGNEAFASNGMQELTGMNNVKTIGNKAFRGNNIASLILPNGVQTIGFMAFSDNAFAEVTIPSSIIEWTGNPFTRCTNLAKFTGKYASDTGRYLFDGNTFLAYAIASGSTFSVPSEFDTIGKGAFYSSNKWLTITLSDNISILEDYALNSRVISNIPETIKYIGQYACCISSGYGTAPSVTLPNIETLCSHAFDGSNYTSIILGDKLKEIPSYCFYHTQITRLYIGKNVERVGSTFVTDGCRSIYIYANTAPSIEANALRYVASAGTFYYPFGSDYSTWIEPLIQAGWTCKSSYEPQTYYDLQITAEDVIGNVIATNISWTCMSDGIDSFTGETVTGIQLSGTATSEEFPQNTSETETVERTITFEYQGLTASTTITQGVWVNPNYELILNDNWQLSTDVANPDSALYDGVYESFSNHNIASTAAIMYIDIVGYETFQLYIRSYGNAYWDYVMVSQIDQTIDNNSSYSNTTLVKAHTYGTSKSGTTISDYTLVEFTGLDAGEHRITVVYRRHSSSYLGTDKGYLIIPRQ